MPLHTYMHELVSGPSQKRDNKNIPIIQMESADTLILRGLIFSRRKILKSTTVLQQNPV